MRLPAKLPFVHSQSKRRQKKSQGCRLIRILERAKKTVCIDHHISNTGFADVNLINPDASSTSEMLAGVMSGKYMDTQIARSLFLGIVHDTGVFQYPSTSPDTHRIAADLLEYGFDGLSSEDTLKKALTYANASASIVTTRKGALRVMPTTEEVDAFLEKQNS